MLRHVAPHQIRPPKGDCVVLCDRDQTLLLVLKHLLEKLGFSVFTASQAKKGLHLIHTEQPQLLVWELNKQPDIDFRMLQDVQHFNVRPYVILLSTPVTLTDDAPIDELGSGDVFIKPFEPVDLIRRVKWLLRKEKI